VGDDGHLDVEQRRAHRAAEQLLVALVVGCATSATQAAAARARRLDVDVESGPWKATRW
jgi:predicted component of type VI protein secretion system